MNIEQQTAELNRIGDLRKAGNHKAANQAWNDLVYRVTMAGIEKRNAERAAKSVKPVGGDGAFAKDQFPAMRVTEFSRN